ncbi:MAG: carboxylate-amine ligase [Alphaproteobacteria bacterium]|nr:carboxylate-amine ligase [Alphaproteobacteria bacterium]
MDDLRWPEPGSAAELAAYEQLQAGARELYLRLSTYPRTPQTVVVVPSLSLDQRELDKIAGVPHYEERMLVNLMLLKQPRTKVVFVTSQAIHPIIVDYYLSMLPGVPPAHARRRLTLLHCSDGSNAPLTAKILARPRLLDQIRGEIIDAHAAHLVCFNSTDRERTLAVRLGIPLNSVDPSLHDLGTKSGCREIFREAGVRFPPGFERLGGVDDVARALAALQRANPHLRKAVVKLNEGFSGEGNATIRTAAWDASGSEAEVARRIADVLPTALTFESPHETWEGYAAKFSEMGGVVEAWVEGATASPSAQCRVNAMGLPQVISTHDQVLGGPTGQVFLGARFPAADAYRLTIQRDAAHIASVLADRGVIGRFGIDFVSVPTPDGGWEHHAIEVNLRKGGTTHPFLTLKFLTDGTYDPEDGLFYSQSGRAKYYLASDNLVSERYVGLRPEDLMDIAVFHGLHFHGASERGVVFHLIGALSQHGKLGIVAIGDNPAQANFLYQQCLEVLDEETGPRRGRPGSATG